MRATQFCSFYLGDNESELTLGFPSEHPSCVLCSQVINTKGYLHIRVCDTSQILPLLFFVCKTHPSHLRFASMNETETNRCISNPFISARLVASLMLLYFGKFVQCGINKGFFVFFFFFQNNARAHVCQRTTHRHNLIMECLVFILCVQQCANWYFC